MLGSLALRILRSLMLSVPPAYLTSFFCLSWFISLLFTGCISNLLIPESSDRYVKLLTFGRFFW